MIIALSPKTPTEQVIVTWDFEQVATGTISGPSIAKSTIVGNDPSAASLVLSAPVITDLNVSALVSAGTDNCSYLLKCTVSDSSGEVHQSTASITTVEVTV